MSPNPIYFEIVFAEGGYRAHVKSTDHKLIWWTQVYKEKRSAEHAIGLLRAYAATAPLIDRTNLRRTA